jgi:hypothetical protein
MKFFIPLNVSDHYVNGRRAASNQRKDVPGTIDVSKLAAFCDPEQIIWGGGTATVLNTGCTFTSKIVGIPGHPFLVGSFDILILPFIRAV